jgi:hypothetical protein
MGETPRSFDDTGSLASAAVLIGATGLIAPELIGGVALGAGFVLASKWVPDLLGNVTKPLVKSAVKIGYSAASRASEIVAEATEQIQDTIAEARAEAEAEDHSQSA